MSKIYHNLWDIKEVRCSIIVSFALILSIVIYCLCTRYQMLAISERNCHHVYMYDRITGKTWKTLEGPPYYYIPIFSISDQEAKEIILQEKKK